MTDKTMGKLASLILTVIISLVVGAENSLAKQTNIAQATKTLKRWLKAHPAPLRTTLGANIKEIKTYTDQGEVSYYVFFLAPKGFVVVSADDLVEPIIAFSPSDKFDPSEKHPLGSMLKKDLPQRLIKAREEEAGKRLMGLALSKSHQKALSKWEKLMKVRDDVPQIHSAATISDIRVSPLTESVWSQSEEGSGYCYNYYTPNHYVCGCVATAMAQFMRYYSYPTSPVVSTKTVYVDGFPSSATIRGGNGSGGSYNWNSMVLDPSASTGITERQAIGALTFDAGVSVGMEYEYSGSGISVDGSAITIASALKSTFRYSNAIAGDSGHWYANISSSKLNRMMNTNLDAKIPVLLTVCGDDCHEIVGDGYGYDSSSTLYHHLNMGWGAEEPAANVWYNLPDIDDFNVVNQCVYNIYTSGSGEIISGRVLDADGNPISEATVTGTTGSGSFSAVTDDSGIYALTKIPSWTNVVISAEKSGYTFPSTSVSTGKSTNGTTTVGNLWGVDIQAQSGGCDTTPDAFGFNDQTGVALATMITSNAITVSGMTCEAEIAITDGTYSINGGAYTSSVGTVGNGDTVTVQLMSSGDYATTADATLTIGVLSDTFSVTTLVRDTTSNAFTFEDQTNVALNSTITSNTITVSGITSAVPISISGGSYSVNGGTYTSAAGMVVSGDTVAVQVVSSGNYSTTTSAVLTIGGVSDTFSVTTLACDTVPDVFTFIDRTNVTVSTTITSNTITVGGTTCPALISITGGAYSVNGGAYASAAGTVNSGDTVSVQLTSSAYPSTRTYAILTIGGVSDIFSATTGTCDTAPDAFSFSDRTDANLNTVVTSDTITISGISCATPITITGGTYAVNGGAYTTASGTVNSGNTVSVRLTSSANYAATKSATLTIGGVSDSFSVTTMGFCDMTPDAFTFAGQTEVALNTMITSNAITVSGVTCDAPISITGGTYAVNSGDDSSADGTVSDGDTVIVRLMSAGTTLTTTYATLSIGGVSDTFAVTTEASGVSQRLDYVQKIYIGYYQRPADPAGLIYWADQLAASSGNLENIVESFANAEESQALYGVITSRNIATVINSIYRALFNRDADAAGRDYYVAGFNSGAFTTATIMLNILNGAQDNDLVTLNNKLITANLFTRIIDPDLDGSDLQVTYEGNSDAIAARYFLSLVSSSSATVPTQSETKEYIRSYIANPNDGIFNP